MKATIVPAAFLAVILASGCTGIPSPQPPGAGDIIADPAAYYGEEHAITASPVEAGGGAFGYYISEGGDRLYLNYTRFGCEDCVIRGTVEKAWMCDCMSATCNGKDCMPAGDDWKFLDVRYPSDCEERVATMVIGSLVVRNFFRCGAGTERDLYFLQVSSVAAAEP